MASRYPQALEVRTAGRSDTGECSICTESLTDTQESLAVCVECTAAFHETCLNRWIRVQEIAGDSVICPICRRGYGEAVEEQEVSRSELAAQIRVQELEEANAAAARMTRLEANVRDLDGWAASVKAVLDCAPYSEPHPRPPPPPTPSGRLARLEQEVQGLRVRVAGLNPFRIADPQPRTPPTEPSAHLTRLEADTSELYQRVRALRGIREPAPPPRRPKPPTPPTTGFSTVSTGITYTTLPLSQQGSEIGPWSLPSRTGSRVSSLSFDDSRPVSLHDVVDPDIHRRPASYVRRRPSSSHASRPSTSSDDSSIDSSDNDDDETAHLRHHVHDRQGQRQSSHTHRRPRTKRREGPGRSNGGGSAFVRRFVGFAAGRPFSTRQIGIRRDSANRGRFERMPRR